jgi:hypothetical protein
VGFKRKDVFAILSTDVGATCGRVLLTLAAATDGETKAGWLFNVLNSTLEMLVPGIFDGGKLANDDTVVVPFCEVVAAEAHAP